MNFETDSRCLSASMKKSSRRIVGDEEDVEIALGLRSKRATPAPIYHTA